MQETSTATAAAAAGPAHSARPNTQVNLKKRDAETIVGPELKRRIEAAADRTEWSAVGKQQGLKIWCMEEYGIKVWQKNRYGKFRTGCAYLILDTKEIQTTSTTKKSFAFHAHVWIGNECPYNDYATAVYKMVDLDQHTGGRVVKHREVQENESNRFLEYFEEPLEYLKGGSSSSSNKAQQEQNLSESPNAEPRLYKIKGRKEIALLLTQEKVRRDSLNSGDVFILVVEEEAVYLWVGKDSNNDEKTKGTQVAKAFSRSGAIMVLDQGINDGENQIPQFWQFMPARVSTMGIFSRSVDIQDADNDDDKVTKFIPVLYQIQLAEAISLKKMAAAIEVPISPQSEQTYLGLKRSFLKKKYGYLLDTGFHLYVWIGLSADASIPEKVTAITSHYFERYRRPILPVAIVKHGQEIFDFDRNFYEPDPGCSCSIV